MEVRVLKGSENSDFPQGCIEITAFSLGDSFDLGELFQILVQNGSKVVRSSFNGSSFIRVPLTPENNTVLKKGVENA